MFDAIDVGHWCKVMRQKCGGRLKSLGVWKVGGKPNSPFPLLTAVGPVERCISSPAESGTEPQPKSNLVDLKKTLLAAFRWASHEDSEEKRQRQFSIKAVLVHSVWLSYTMQRCLLVTLHAHPQPDSGLRIRALKLPLIGNSAGRWLPTRVAPAVSHKVSVATCRPYDTC